MVDLCNPPGKVELINVGLDSSKFIGSYVKYLWELILHLNGAGSGYSHDYQVDNNYESSHGLKSAAPFMRPNPTNVQAAQVRVLVNLLSTI